MKNRDLDLKVASVKEARQYCQSLASKHYENFTVLIPGLDARRRQDFANIYAYCRWADDLADELEDYRESLDQLNRFETMLKSIFAGSETRHPVFWALSETIQRRELTEKPFLDLTSAFKQDQVKTEYDTFDELIDYCRRSADPVGRLVLACFDADSEENIHYSDMTCSALQLTNFWADVAIDLDKGRRYIPAEDMKRFGVTDADLERREVNSKIRDLLAFEIARTRDWLEAGRELINRLGFVAGLSVELFNSGGMAVLNKIEKNNYEIFEQRWTLSRKDKMVIITRGLFRQLWRRFF